MPGRGHSVREVTEVGKNYGRNSRWSPDCSIWCLEGCGSSDVGMVSLANKCLLSGH
jgi:hypothetical protein